MSMVVNIFLSGKRPLMTRQASEDLVLRTLVVFLRLPALEHEPDYPLEKRLKKRIKTSLASS